MKGRIMTETAEDRQSDEIVANRIRFACDSMGMSDDEGQDMARRAVALRAKAHTRRGPVFVKVVVTRIRFQAARFSAPPMGPPPPALWVSASSAPW